METSPATIIPRDKLNLWKVFRDVGPEGEKILSLAKLAHVDDDRKGFVVTLDDETYSFLRDEENTGECKITRIPELCRVRVKEFFVGSIYLALTEDGALYSWIKEDGKHPECDDDVQNLGRIKPATLDWGHPDTMTFFVTPHLIQGGLTGKKVRQVALSLRGRVMALTVGGEVYQWGEIGYSSAEPVLIAMENFDRQEVVAIACTDMVSFALTWNGKLFKWEFGSKPKKVVRYGSLSHYKKLCASRNLVFALTCDGQLHCLMTGDCGRTNAFDSQKFQDIATFGCRTDDIMVEVKDDTRFAFGFSVGNSDRVVEQVLNTRRVISYLPSCTSSDEFSAEICGTTYRTICAQNLAKPRTVVDDIGNLFSNKESADVTFSMEGKTIRAHKLILKSRSDYFMKMFSNVWKESDGGVIEIKDTTYEIFEALVFYLYHGRVPFSEEDYANISDLMKLADSYCHVKLREDCEKILIRNITTENVIFLVRNASSVNAWNLEEEAIKVIRTNGQVLELTDKSQDDLIALIGQDAVNKIALAALRG